MLVRIRRSVGLATRAKECHKVKLLGDRKITDCPGSVLTRHASQQGYRCLGAPAVGARRPALVRGPAVHPQVDAGARPCVELRRATRSHAHLLVIVPGLALYHHIAIQIGL